jgi:hypothetical protein
VADVLYLHPTTDKAIPVSRVLDGARICAEALVLGWTDTGTFYAASTTSDGGELLWLIERFKFALLSGEYM